MCVPTLDLLLTLSYWQKRLVLQLACAPKETRKRDVVVDAQGSCFICRRKFIKDWCGVCSRWTTAFAALQSHLPVLRDLQVAALLSTAVLSCTQLSASRTFTDATNFTHPFFKSPTAVNLSPRLLELRPLILHSRLDRRFEQLDLGRLIFAYTLPIRILLFLHTVQASTLLQEQQTTARP